MPFCKDCGKALGDTDKFCPQCGHALGISESLPPASTGLSSGSPPAAVRAAWGKTSLWFTLGVAVILIAVACGLVFGVFRDSIFDGGGQATPEETVRNMMSALERGDIAKALDLYDPAVLEETARYMGITVAELRTQAVRDFRLSGERVRYSDVELASELSDDGQFAVVTMVAGTMTEIDADGTETVYGVQDNFGWAGSHFLVLKYGKWYLTDDETEYDTEYSPDANAKSLLRNAMTTIESAYVDLRTFDPDVMTPALLAEIEPTISFLVSGGPTTPFMAPSASAEQDEVEYFGDLQFYAIGCVSESGRSLGVYVDKGAGGGNLFYVDGVATDW